LEGDEEMCLDGDEEIYLEGDEEMSLGGDKELYMRTINLFSWFTLIAITD
jgi:hypothetical protein